VDGLVCRIVMRPKYVIGQAISAVIEIKNVSEKTRYIAPHLDPDGVEHLLIEIIGPDEQRVRQTHSARYGLHANSFKPIGPGEIKRHEVADLRSYFADLDPSWRARIAQNVPPPTGKYEVQCRFRSPEVPKQFLVGQRLVAGKVEAEYTAPAAALVANQWANEVRPAPITFQLLPLQKDDLTVHEWGVFTVSNDVKYANVNRKEEWGSLPNFFYRQFPKERLRWMPAAWDKPIIYFYAKPTQQRLDVSVTFPEGAPVVWWPAVSDPYDDSTFRTGRDPKKPRPFQTLNWRLWLGDEVPADIVGLGLMRRRHEPGTVLKVTDFPLPPDSWLRQARLPSATQLTAVGMTDEPTTRLFPGAPDRLETERFLYYDGLVPAPDFVRCQKVQGDAVTLSNRAKFDIQRLFVVDRRGKSAVGFAYFDGVQRPFKSGTSLTVEFKRVVESAWPATGRKQLRQALVDVGLFEAEADSFLTIWQKRLLEVEGVTVFHILPAAEYDRQLPLRITPPPAAPPIRIGIALHPHVEIEPERRTLVAGLIRDLGDDKFEKRNAASKKLSELGPLAVAGLRAELGKKPPLETSRRIEAILDRVDAASWLNLPAASNKSP